MKLRYPLLALIIFILFHLACHFQDWYLKIWWTDIVAHFWAGVTSGLFWWWLVEKKKINSFFSTIHSISIITLATTISVLWEFWEFSNWRYQFLRNTTGKLEIQYYPYLGNNLGDIFWGMIGGLVIAAIFFATEKRKLKRKD